MTTRCKYKSTMEDDFVFSDDVDGGSVQSSGSSNSTTPRAMMRRPVTVRSKLFFIVAEATSCEC